MFQSRPIRTKDDLTKLQDQYKRYVGNNRPYGMLSLFFFFFTVDLVFIQDVVAAFQTGLEVFWDA